MTNDRDDGNPGPASAAPGDKSPEQNPGDEPGVNQPAVAGRRAVLKGFLVSGGLFAVADAAASGAAGAAQATI
ncbi:MAG: hypothetical protein JWN69_1484, partial [Alphaproteobacteria bacterium]|nr:hypothetical protein [Alphaproteobacteria bacterium]